MNRVTITGANCSVWSAHTERERERERDMAMLERRGLKYRNGSVPTRKFQSVVHTCEERMAVDWTSGRSGNE